MECGFNETSTLKKALFIATFDRNTTLNLFTTLKKKGSVTNRVGKLQFIVLTRMNINKKINEIINVQLMVINVQNNARSAPKLKR